MSGASESAPVEFTFCTVDWSYKKLRCKSTETATIGRLFAKYCVHANSNLMTTILCFRGRRMHLGETLTDCGVTNNSVIEVVVDSEVGYSPFHIMRNARIVSVNLAPDNDCAITSSVNIELDAPIENFILRVFGSFIDMRDVTFTHNKEPIDTLRSASDQGIGYGSTIRFSVF